MLGKPSNKDQNEFKEKLNAEFKYVLWLIISINFLVYIFLLKKGVHPTSPSATDLVQWGANYGPRTARGELWRLFTSLFVHAGSVHLVSNMITLAVVGRYCFAIFGQNISLLIYLAGGLCGAALGTFTHPDTLSVGASGAIFSLFGSLLVFSIKNFKTSEVIKNLSLNLIIAILQNLAIGFFSSEIDNSAHLGGLLTGISLGALYCFDIFVNKKFINFTIGASLSFMVLALFAPRHFDRLKVLAKVERPMMQINSSFLHQRKQFKMKNLSPQDFTNNLKQQCLDPIRMLLTELESNEHPQEPGVIEIHTAVKNLADKILEVAALTEAANLKPKEDRVETESSPHPTASTPPSDPGTSTNLATGPTRGPASSQTQPSEDSLVSVLNNLEYLESLYAKDPNWSQALDEPQSPNEKLAAILEAEKIVSLKIAEYKSKKVEHQYTTSAVWYGQTLKTFYTSETLKNLSREEIAQLLKSQMSDPLNEQIKELVLFCRKTKEHLKEVSTCTPEHITYLEFSIEIKKEFATLLKTLQSEDPNGTGTPKAEALVSALHIPAFNSIETQLFTHRPPAQQTTLERRKKIEAILEGLRRALANYTLGVNRHSKDQVKSAHQIIQQIHNYLTNPEQF